jgi:hypothetical protein
LLAGQIARAEVDDALGIGDVAVLIGRIHNRGKTSGLGSVSPAGWMLKLRNGKVLQFHALAEAAKALGAGLSPPPADSGLPNPELGEDRAELPLQDAAIRVARC